MPKYGFNKVAKQFGPYFQNMFSYEHLWKAASAFWMCFIVHHGNIVRSYPRDAMKWKLSCKRNKQRKALSE